MLGDLKNFRQLWMVWSVFKGFITGFFLTWLLWAAVSVIAVYQFNYTGPTNGATFWCLLFGLVGAWRGRTKHKQKNICETDVTEG